MSERDGCKFPARTWFVEMTVVMFRIATAQKCVLVPNWLTEKEAALF